MVPADVLSRQALEAQAGDLAIEDALYAVEKALQEGALGPDVYIKQARPKPLYQLRFHVCSDTAEARYAPALLWGTTDGGPPGTIASSPPYSH